MENQMRKKLDLELNAPKELMLLFDNPIVGENRYGPYYLYAFADVHNGSTEYSHFASPELHEQLSQFNAGDVVTLTKSAKQVGKKVVTELTATPVNSTMKSQTPVSASATHKSDKLFEVLQTCYADAIRMQERFNGMVDVNRIAITLFIARSKTNGHALASGVSS